MSECRDPVVHKICIRKLNGYLFILNKIVSENICIRKLNGYLFILNEIVSEKWKSTGGGRSLEKSWSSLLEE